MFVFLQAASESLLKPGNIVMSFFFAWAFLHVAGSWLIFEKAGKRGITSLIPFYNITVLLRLAKKPLWWIIFFILPFFPTGDKLLKGLFATAGFTCYTMVCLEIAFAFGKTLRYGIGLVLLGFIFFPHLGLSDAKYSSRSS